MTAGLEVSVLGPLQVLRDGRRLPVATNRLRVLLATMATSAGTVMSTDTLSAAVWGGDLPADPRNSLQTYVSRLRRLLGEDAVATRPGGYELQLDAEQVDALRFLRLVAVPRGASNEREVLVEALQLWRGMPYEDIKSDWLARAHADRLTEAYLGALERSADLDLAAGFASELLDRLRAASERHPLREPLCLRLMLALVMSGRRPEALARYEEFRDRLADELGADPSPQLRTIYDELAAAVTDVPRQLPSDILHFTGRSDVLDALDELAAFGEATGEAVAVLHGTGGIGKTAAVVHWAHRAESSFPDGQLFVDLQGYGPGPPMPPAVVLDGLLRALGVEGRKIPHHVDRRATLLREMLAGRRALLVLDNVRDADQVRSLLPGGRTLAVVTSRSRLRELSADHSIRKIPVGELSLDDAMRFLAAAVRDELPAHDARALEELAELCGRLPLALAIAAEQAGRRPRHELGRLVIELRDRWERLDALEVADDPASSVRTVFSWSLDTLASDCVRAFRLLGLYPGPDLGAPAAAALTGMTTAGVRRLLSKLVDAHLLEQRRPGRYQFHDLLRAYAAELASDLDATERDEALNRVLGWYVHTAANARIAIGRGESLGETGALADSLEPLTFSGQQSAIAWFDAERAGLVAAVELAGRIAHDAAYRLAEQLPTYLIVRYAIDDLDTTQRIALDVARHTGDTTAQAVALYRLGTVPRMLGDYERARVLYEQALTQFEALGNDRGRSFAMAHLGTVLEALGDDHAALEREEQGLALARRIGDNNQIITLLNNLAITYLRLRRYGDAVDACRQALEVLPSRAFRNFEPHLLDTLGQALTATGSYDEAIDAYQRSLAKVRELGDRWGESIVLSNLGAALRDVGRPDEAAAHWHEALSVMNENAIADSRDVSRDDLRRRLDALERAHPQTGGKPDRHPHHPA